MARDAPVEELAALHRELDALVLQTSKNLPADFPPPPERGELSGSEDDEAGVDAGLRKVRALGKEAVAGVERVAAFGPGDPDELRRVEIGCGSTTREGDEAIRAVDRRELSVFRRVDGDGFDAPLASRTRDA